MPIPKHPTAPARPWWITAGVLLAVFLAVHGVIWLQSGFFDPLSARVTDRLMVFRAELSLLRPAYDDTVVHVVVDDESVSDLGDFYIGRDDHARLVRNLARTEVAAQLHDVIFAAPQSEDADAALAEATAEAGNVYYGMGAGLSLDRQADREPAAQAPGAAPLLDRIRWHPRVVGDATGMAHSGRLFVTFPRLAEPARGIGFLDVLPDSDGVYRRAPLFVRHGDGWIPSLPLRLASDYLGVSPDRIEIEPGRRILLLGASRPGEEATRDISIPIDDHGQMRVNFLGPWGSMTAYPFSVVYRASDDRFTMMDLRDELQGKIALVSWLATGEEDIGAAPVDALYPRVGIHATVIHSILTGRFLRELGGWATVLWVELPLLAILLVAAVRLSTARFVAVAVIAGAVYAAIVAAAFFWGELVLDLPGPLFVVVNATVVVAALGFHEQSTARARLDKELAVARDIQMDTFPEKMPTYEGYDLAGKSEPAEETGGDSFDVIALDDKRTLLLLADATGHGVGPALSVTQMRSMLRIAVRLGADLDTMLREINDQLADDLASNRFVTAFLGVFDAEAHTVVYHAAGQGPIMHYRAADDAFDWHDSTTIPAGMMEQFMKPDAVTLELAPGDILGLMTDGIYEYEDPSGEQFGQERVAEIIRRLRGEPAERIMAELFTEVRRFARSAPQGDDVTILLLKRA